MRSLFPVSLVTSSMGFLWVSWSRLIRRLSTRIFRNQTEFEPICRLYSFWSLCNLQHCRFLQFITDGSAYILHPSTTAQFGHWRGVSNAFFKNAVQVAVGKPCNFNPRHVDEANIDRERIPSRTQLGYRAYCSANLLLLLRLRLQRISSETSDSRFLGAELVFLHQLNHHQQPRFCCK